MKVSALMQLRKLRHFLTIIESGSFWSAADALEISQSTLTRSVQQLERDLGVHLLQRLPRKSVPTLAGERLADFARMILRDCDSATEAIRTVKAGVAGEVTLATDPMFASSLVAPSVARMTAEAPNVELRLFANHTDSLVTLVARSQCDLAIVHCDDARLLPKGLQFEPLFRFKTVVSVDRSHTLARQRSVDVRSLATANWVVLSEPASIEAYARFFAVRNIPQPRAVRMNSYRLIRDAVMHGGFVSLLPVPVIDRELRHRRVKALPFEVVQEPSTAGILINVRLPASAAAARVVRCVREFSSRSAFVATTRQPEARTT